MDWKAVAIAFIMVSAIPVGSSQTSTNDGFFLLGEDSLDDNDMSIAGEPYEESPFDPADLLALEIKETARSLMLKIKVAGLTPQDSAWTANGNPQLDYSYYYYEITFEGMEHTFEVNVYYNVNNGEISSSNGYLYTIYESENRYTYSYVGELAVTMDPVDSAILVDIPRDFLLDTGGRAPSIGDVFSQYAVYSRGQSDSSSFTFGLVRSQDMLPDNGVLPTSWTMMDGLVSSGHLQARSEFPTRVSNGEATTFLFEVEVKNTANFVDSVLPSWEGGLENWIVTFPDGKVRLESGETKVIPFLVTVPFAHSHGQYYPFIVTFQSQADPLAAGKVELGVRYTAVPQPAGHHAEVYLHELQNDLFFNTIDGDDFPESASEDELGDLERANSYTCGNPGDVDGEAYTIPLSPRLEMGVDFDLEALGKASILSTSERGAEGIWYDGWIVVDTDRPSTCAHYYGGPDNVAARIEPSAPVDVSSGGSSLSESVITPLAKGDYIPYEDGLQMWFIIVQHRDEIAPNDVICCINDEFEATISPGSSLLLPLSEYHDDVDDFFNRLTGTDLYATSPQERLVNPGKTVLFRVTAQNIGAVESEFTLQLTGAKTEWARVLGDIQKIKLKPGEAREMVVAVVVPTSASDGDLVDVSLILSNREDDSLRSIIRFLAEVDTHADHDDESASSGILDAEMQQAPSPFVSVLAALALFGVALRRWLD